MKNILNIDELRKNCHVLHFFGLGFLQLKLKNGSRLHFYTPKYQQTSLDDDLHNHRQNFSSTILKGVFYQEIYEIEKLSSYDEAQRRGHSHWMIQESCKEGQKGPTPTWPIIPTKVYQKYYSEGDSYYLNHESFHTVKASEGCITHLVRSRTMKEFADVCFPVGTKPVCPFSVKISESELWDEVARLTNL